MELPIRIAVTLPIFEEFAREAGRENVEVFSLIPPGADPHTYEFTPQDLDRMKGVDFFFLNGAGLDSRLHDVIEANRDESAHVIPFAPNILSPTVSGHTAEQAGDNPHLWLDPALAYVYVEIVADELIIYDGVRESFYNGNFNAFKERMLQLQNELYGKLQPLPAGRRGLVTYHDSFSHFARKFEMEDAEYAVESPGSAPADGAVDELRNSIQQKGIPALFQEFGYDSALIEQLAAQSGTLLCTLYSDIVEEGRTYEDFMRANADEIVRCLGG